MNNLSILSGGVSPFPPNPSFVTSGLGIATATTLNGDIIPNLGTIIGAGGTAYAVIAPVSIFIKGVVVASSGMSGTDIASVTFTMPAGTTRWRLLGGATTSGTSFAVNEGTTLSGLTFTVFDSASGAGIQMSVASVAMGSISTPNSVCIGAPVATGPQLSSAASAYIHATGNPAATGSLSFCLAMQFIP